MHACMLYNMHYTLSKKMANPQPKTHYLILAKLSFKMAFQVRTSAPFLADIRVFVHNSDVHDGMM